MEGSQHKKDQTKGDFKQYKVTNLDAFVLMYKYDNLLAKAGSKKMPGKEEQKQMYKKLFGGFKVNAENLIYHVVSMKWMQRWEAYVGIKAGSKS